MSTASARISNVNERQHKKTQSRTQNAQGGLKGRLQPRRTFVLFVFCFVFFAVKQVSPVRTLVKSASRQRAAAHRVNRLLTRGAVRSPPGARDAVKSEIDRRRIGAAVTGLEAERGCASIGKAAVRAGIVDQIGKRVERGA